jgi:hypothetical protein
MDVSSRVVLTGVALALREERRKIVGISANRVIFQEGQRLRRSLFVREVEHDELRRCWEGVTKLERLPVFRQSRSIRRVEQVNALLDQVKYLGRVENSFHYPGLRRGQLILKIDSV